MNDKQERAEKINQLIKTIADCGRRFFYTKSQETYASIEVDHRGKIWFIDDYTRKRIYTHYRNTWKGFSHGGTLRDLVIAFREFISKAKPLPKFAFGPWPDHFCDGDLWGYGEDMKKVRDKAMSLGLISQ